MKRLGAKIEVILSPKEGFDDNVQSSDRAQKTIVPLLIAVFMGISSMVQAADVFGALGKNNKLGDPLPNVATVTAPSNKIIKPGVVLGSSLAAKTKLDLNKTVLGITKITSGGGNVYIIATSNVGKVAKFIAENNIGNVESVGLGEGELRVRLRIGAVENAENAENADNAETKSVGGIDMNTSEMNLQIKRDGEGVPLPVSQQNLENIRINGLVPVILDIQPATVLPLFGQMQ
jgi:hypothetical protein